MSKDAPAKDSFKLPSGITLTFSTLMAGDLIDAVKQLGSSLEEADPYESSLVLAWRSAVRGGYEGDFRSFIDQIPMTVVQEVIKTATPFLGASTPQE